MVGLSQLEIDGYRHLRAQNLDALGHFINSGGQFVAFEDGFGALQGVIKRVKLLSKQNDFDFEIRSRFRPLQLEISSLRDPRDPQVGIRH